MHEKRLCKTLWYDKKYDANVFGTKLLTQILGKKIEDMYLNQFTPWKNV